MEVQKNRKIISIIIFIMLISCRGIYNYSYKIPDRVLLKIDDKDYVLNDKKSINGIIQDLNSSKLINESEPIPYRFEIQLIYKDTVINIKSDGVYYIDNNLKLHPNTDLLYKYWKFKDEDLLPKRPLQKL